MRKYVQSGDDQSPASALLDHPRFLVELKGAAEMPDMKQSDAMDMQLSSDDLLNIFNAIPDVVFFIKDRGFRYTHVNNTMVRRLGMKNREELIGKTALQLFPERLGSSYVSQDKRVLEGEVIENQLELHLYANRTAGWCLTIKRPLSDSNGINGLVGISRDLGRPDSGHSSFTRLQSALAHMQANFGLPMRIQELATIAGVSVAQLERLFKRVFQLSPHQMLTKLRIEEAMRLLQTGMNIAEIGQTCGFSDQSAFSRQFKASVSISPRDYRAMVR